MIGKAVYDSDEYLDMDAIGKLRQNREFKKVYEIIKDKHLKSPKNGFILSQYLLAIIHYKPSDSGEIKEVVDKLSTTKRKDFYEFGLVVYNLSLNDASEAYKHYKDIKNPFLYRFLTYNMHFYDCSKKFRELLFDINSALKEIENPELSDIKYCFLSYDIGEYYFEHKKYQNAIAYYKLSIGRRIEAKQSICYWKLGRCYSKLYDLKECEDSYIKALRLAKKYDNINYNKLLYDYIYSLNDLGQCRKASKLYQLLSKNTQKEINMATLVKGKIFKNEEQFDDAIVIFESLLGNKGLDEEQALTELVKTYLCLSDEENASKYLDILFEKYPDHNPSIKMSFYYDLYKFKETIDFCNGYLDTEYADEAKYYIGRSLNRLNRPKKAIKYLEEVNGKITNLNYKYELGLCYDRLGDYEKSFTYYNEYINISAKKKDRKSLNKGLCTIIDTLLNQYRFDEAYGYIELYESINPESINSTIYMKAQLYYHKQDYNHAEEYFKMLYGTEYELRAKNYLVIIYRFSGETDKASQTLNELENTDFDDEVKFNRVRLLEDIHTKESLDEAYNWLITIHKDEIESMVCIEKVRLLSKLGKYDIALNILREGYNNHDVEYSEYCRYRSYLSYKLGINHDVNFGMNDKFMNVVLNYRYIDIVERIIHMKDSNLGKKEFYLNNDEIVDLYNTFNGHLDEYDYYMSELYDVYVIDFGKPIGSFFGIETSLIEIKCEQNTHNIHIIQPTLKRVNVNKYNGKIRKKLI